MKKLLIILILIFSAVFNLDAQLKFKAGLISGPTANSVDITIQPTVNFTGYLTNVVFIFQIPVGVVQPTITKLVIPVNSSFSTINDLPTLPNVNNFVTYGFSAVNTGVTPITINAGINYPLFRLTFSGGPMTPTNVRLAHLADGGPNSIYQNYIEANAVGPGTNDYTNYVQMFFGGNVEPLIPYGDEATGYANYQFTQIAQVLPVTWLAFSATKRGNDGLLNWLVANEDDNHYYEVLRSSDGQNFATIAQVNNTGYGNYEYTDPGIANFGAPVLYYRIKQVDINGKYSFSVIKPLTFDLKGNEISIYPNPVKEGFYVSIPFINPDNRIVTLNLIAANGQRVLSKEIKSLQAANYYFKIDDKVITAGQYTLQIIFDEKVIETKKLTVIH